MNSNLRCSDSRMVIQSATIPMPVTIGQPVDGLFRFGSCCAQLSRDGRHAWSMDLYQRRSELTGKALASEVSAFPQNDSVVRVKGHLVEGESGAFLWVRELLAEVGISINTCALDLAAPRWVVDQSEVDALSEIWSTLASPYRELINAVLSDGSVLQGFLQAPGSVRYHDSVTGGCVAHTVRAAKMAVAIAEQTTEINRDLLVAGAIMHDVGKSIEYCQNNYGQWGMSRFGKRVGHKVGGALIVGYAARQCRLLADTQLEDILHLMTCSYAPTWAGYRLPATNEALAMSAIDRLVAGSAYIQ